MLPGLATHDKSAGKGWALRLTCKNVSIRLETAEEVRGWFLLRELQLQPAAEAMILTIMRGSRTYMDVDAIIKSVFLQGAARTSTGSRFMKVLKALPRKARRTEFYPDFDVFQALTLKA